jgi:Tol biopolymer transport system component
MAPRSHLEHEINDRTSHGLRTPRRVASGALLCVLAALTVAAAVPARGAPATVAAGTIVFASERSGSSQIYSVRADGSRLGQLTRNRYGDSAPLFSPDGRRIVFARSTRCCSGLWLMNADGSGQRPLAAYASDPAWSPDSQRIAYATCGCGKPQGLVIASVVGRQRIFIRGGTGRPSWSPDGAWIAFNRPVGDYYSVMVLRSGGGRPRTVWRRVWGDNPLGWTARGEIVVATPRAFVAIRPEGGRPRRFPGIRRRTYASGLVLSPGATSLAWIDNSRRLLIRRLAGGRTRNVTPKRAGYLQQPAWSADGRRLAVVSLAPGRIFEDILVVAANGSSSRRITQRLPYPYGSENRQPSWRPGGATPGRLGRRPAVPLRSETWSHTRFAAAGGATIGQMAADGDRAAMVINYAHTGCAAVEVWDAKHARVFRVKAPCGFGPSSREDTSGVTLAGDRVAWLHTEGGNTTDTNLDTTTLARGKTVSVAQGGLDDNGAGIAPESPAGDGSLLAFTFDHHCDSGNGEPQDECPAGKKTGYVIAAAVWRVGGDGKCPNHTPKGGGCSQVASAGSELTVLAVDAGRIVVRTETGVEVLSEQGALLRTFGVKARTAALSGNRLAVRTAGAIELYDASSGQLTATVPAAAGVKLEDLEGELLVTALNDIVTVRKLGAGRTTSFRTDGVARGQLEQPGLFVAGPHRVTFTPMGALERRLGA